jgi:anti-sigma regulatory factor (Ser/Thr protein kinase)
MQKTFSRSFTQLELVFDFVKLFETQNNLDPATVHSINLAAEEIFTNMIKYNPKSEHPVLMELRFEERDVIITITDHEEEPFDMTTAEVYDLEQSIEDRPVGKLGLHLVKKVMDKIEYSHKNGKTVIRMVKHLGDKNA